MLLHYVIETFYVGSRVYRVFVSKLLIFKMYTAYLKPTPNGGGCGFWMLSLLPSSSCCAGVRTIN